MNGAYYDFIIIIVLDNVVQNFYQLNSVNYARNKFFRRLFEVLLSDLFEDLFSCSTMSNYKFHIELFSVRKKVAEVVDLDKYNFKACI